MKIDTNEDFEFSEIEIINTEDNTKRKVKFGQEGWLIRSIHLSDDNSKIFFLGVENNICNFVVYDLLNNEQQIITSHKEGSVYGILPSPDGQKILYRVVPSGYGGCGRPDVIHFHLIDVETKKI